MKLEVAVAAPVPGTFTYLADGPVAPGTRVLVPFGRRRLVGVALGPAAEGPASEDAYEIKSVEAVLDDTPVYSEVVLEIARWISAYYLHPLGEVLRTMLPAGSTKVVKETVRLTEAGLACRNGVDSPESFLLSEVFGKKTELTAVTVRNKLKRAGAELKPLLDRGLVTMTRGSSVRARRSKKGPSVNTGIGASVPQAAATVAPPLTPLQERAFRAIVDEGLEKDGAPPFLLHGVTGSGKTEIYMRLIQEVLDRSGGTGQSLIMVPEISLTPQMTRVFETRFPGRVAVVHSALTDADRWERLMKVRSGEAAILIGPRSAVFAPFKDLWLIVVDEEHDGSYKQTTGLTYHGRDVAVLRGKLEGAVVVLGSATPSMESFHNALIGKYRVLELPERVTGRELPEIQLIRSEPAARKGLKVQRGGFVGPVKGDLAGEAEVPISPEVLEALRENLAAGHQAIVLVNRRGYAYYLFSLEQKKAIQCPSCSVSMTLHARSTILRCHYCDHFTKLEKVIEEHPDETLVAVGYGSEKAEDALRERLPGARIARLDSDAVQQREVLPQTLARFRAGEIDILVGTQILAKGHDFPNVTLIAILEVDQILSLPDFRAGERMFQLIVQAAGRAGRATLPGRVLIQTSRESHPVIAAALEQDYKTFAARELEFRKIHAYPPFSRMVAVEFSSPDARQLSQVAQRVENWCDQMAGLRPDVLAKVRVLGPSIPPIETIRGRHRRTVLFAAAEVEPLRRLVSQFTAVFRKLPGDVRMKIDVDPQSLI